MELANSLNTILYCAFVLVCSYISNDEYVWCYLKFILLKIKEEKFVLIFLSILAMIRAAHEISKFRFERTWIWIWDYPFGIKSPPFDSYHVYGGLFVLAIIAGLRMDLKKVVSRNNLLTASIIIVIEFIYFFWIFDVFYHVVFMLEEFKQWNYIMWFIK